MKLCVGLGNPGVKYEATRHNAGFLVIDECARRAGVGLTKSSFHGIWARISCGAEQVILFKPLTYMNLSGRAVLEAMQFYKLTGEDLLVLHDDLDLQSGRIKLGWARGTGGHRGVGSIVDLLGGNDFWRLRLGIGRPSAGVEGADYVLQPFSRSENDVVAKLVEDGANAVEIFYQRGAEAVQQLYHGRE